MFKLYLESNQSYFANYTNDKRMACDEELNAYHYANNYQQQQEAVSSDTNEQRFSLSEFELGMRVRTQIENYLRDDYFDTYGLSNLMTEIVETVDVGPVVYNQMNCEEYLINGNAECFAEGVFYRGTFSMTLYANSVYTWSDIYAVMTQP